MSIQITREDLARLYPRPSGGASAKIWDDYVSAITSVEAAMLNDRYGMTTPERWTAFCAQWGPETSGLRILRESGAYSAEQIVKIFGAGHHSAAVTPAEAKKLAKNGPALFERVYGLGNPRKAAELGNTKPGDGWKFRGLGPEQLTGRRAHTKAAEEIGCSIDDLALPINCYHGALIEWVQSGCNAYADKGDVETCRRIVNGGNPKAQRINGLPEVREAYAEALKVWPVGERAPADPLVAKLGDRGQSVTDLQNRLTALGFPCGPIDGHFGKLTERAVAAFQVAHGMIGTGKTDGALWAAIDAARPVAEVRSDVTKQTLLSAGSETIKATSKSKFWLRWAQRFGILEGADQYFDLGVAESIVSQGEKTKAIIGRATELAVGFPVPAVTTKGLIITALVVMSGIAWGLHRQFDKIEKRRVEDAQSGANLGR